MATKKTFLHVEVTNKEYHIQYSGSFKMSDDKKVYMHDERLMSMLMANDDILDFWYRIVMPVVRFKRREARRQLKQQKTGLEA